MIWPLCFTLNIITNVNVVLPRVRNKDNYDNNKVLGL